MAKISFVYFDVGGVAIKDFSDTSKWHETTDFLRIKEDKKTLFFDLYNEADDSICLGDLSIDKWIRNVQVQLGITISQDFSFLNYFLDNFSQNSSLWPIINTLKSQVKIGLLTDMWPDMLSQLFERKLLPPYEWDAVVDSTLEHVRKPMPEIYKIAEKRANVPASEILFIDNREKNLGPARGRDWQTFFYDSKDYDKATRELEAFLKL